MKGFSIRVHVGNPPRKQNLHARKLRERSASRSSRESRGESRYIVEAHLNVHVHHYLRAIFRESNRERYYETPVTAKAKTVRAKEPRKPSRKLMRIRTKSLPGFRRRSSVYLSIYLSIYLSMYACMHACMHVLYLPLFLVVCLSICSLSN